jgi:hypothetical protein
MASIDHSAFFTRTTSRIAAMLIKPALPPADRGRDPNEDVKVSLTS